MTPATITTALACLTLGFAITGASGSEAFDTATKPPTKTSEPIGLGLDRTTAVVVPETLVDAAGRSARVLLPLKDGELSLQLHRHDVRAADFQLLLDTGESRFESIEPLPSETYRGVIEGDPESAVAISIHPDGIAGRIRSGDGRELWIEPAPNRPRGAGPRAHLVYESDDIRPTDARCGVPDVAIGPRPRPDLHGPAPADDQFRRGNLCKAQIVIDCDFPFFQRMGEDLDALGRRVELVLSTMNLQYNTEVGIDHILTAIVVRTNAGADPYEGAIMCDFGGLGLEDQVAEVWAPGNQPFILRDIAHMFTGRIDGGVIGCNFVGEVCAEAPYGVSSIDYNGNLATSTDLLAHELGHGWGATHCSCFDPPYTMNASLTNANRFRPDLTIPAITAYRDANDDCLDCGGASTIGCGEVGNSCYAPTATGSPHCQDEDCCMVMCAIDPFCCDTAWDLNCASQAFTTCADCGDPDAGGPFEANGTPGCSELDCCEAVCSVDAFCCTTEWDLKCVETALATCGGCGAPDGGSPYQEHIGGTTDAACCESICLEDPFCCLTAWDNFCVQSSLRICADCGDPASGSPFLARGNPGSDSLACCEEVCPVDLFCCENAWDDQCAARAALSCGGWCLGDLNFDGKVAGDDLGLLVTEWNSASALLADLNDDGIVDGADFGVFLGNWGDCGY
ncbi:MAG: zinc-dependent metalloprotease family protein [Planctomycetota bacterium]|nr:zinc-dependent metalloprotease family protein [Planctomycetota bacterium]